MFYQHLDLTVWIEQVSEFTGTNGTSLDTGRVTAIACAVNAKGTFFDDAALPRSIAEDVNFRVDLFRGDFGVGPVEASRAVWTGRHAVAAADAPIVINYSDAVRVLPGRLGRAGSYTFGILTLLTGDRHVNHTFCRLEAMIEGWISRLQIDKADNLFALEFEYAYPMNLRIAGLIVLSDTGIDTAPTSDAAGKVQTIAEKYVRIGRLVSQNKLTAVFLLILLQQAFFHIFEFFRRHFLEIALKKFR